jgi:hypothetical protein
MGSPMTQTWGQSKLDGRSLFLQFRPRGGRRRGGRKMPRVVHNSSHVVEKRKSTENATRLEERTAWAPDTRRPAPEI